MAIKTPLTKTDSIEKIKEYIHRASDFPITISSSFYRDYICPSNCGAC